MGKKTEASSDSLGEGKLIKVGKQLLSPRKSKDDLIKALQEALKLLENAPVGSETIKDACADVVKAVGRNDLLKHRDKEVRMYVAAGALHILRLFVPDIPFTDEQLETIFRLLLTMFRQLEDKTVPHFNLSLSLLEHAARLKCFVILLDFENANSLLLELVTTLMDAVNQENAEMMEEASLEILSGVLEEADDIPQPLLDAVLGKLLSDENPAAHRLAQRLVSRTQAALQPYIRKFLIRLLDGQQTDSELADQKSHLVLAVYRVAPQAMLPVLPHLAPSLQIANTERRVEAVDLVASILSQPTAAQLLHDFPELPEALLRRLEDLDRSVRLRALSHAKSLVDAASDDTHRHRIASAVSLRLKDFDEGLRIKAATVLCDIAAGHPQAVRSAEYELLLSRLRDRRPAVRKATAKAVAKLVRVWCTRREDGSGPAAQPSMVVDMAMGLCTLAASNDVELAVCILDEAFKSGVFPCQLPCSSTARWWAQAWAAGKRTQRNAVGALLRGKCELQGHVQEALRLRDAVKAGQRTRSIALGPASTLSPGASGQTAGDDGASDADAESQLRSRLAVLATALRDVPKAEEGLHKLWASKDNHVFRALVTLSTFGTSFADATAAGVELKERVGSRGHAAEVAAALAARMTPNLLAPEVLVAALHASGDSEDAHALVLDVAEMAPQLFARSLPALTSLFDMDEALSAESAAHVLAAAGPYILANAAASSSQQPATTDPNDPGSTAALPSLSQEIIDRLSELCRTGSPAGAKAAVTALARGLETEHSIPVLKSICVDLLQSLTEDEMLRNHSRVLSALKALSMVGRLLPDLFAEFVRELYHVVAGDLVRRDMSGGKPLRTCRAAAGDGAMTPTIKSTGLVNDDDAPGNVWGRPSPDVAIKAAALKAFAQALVPDAAAATIPDETKEVAAAFIAYLGELTDVDTAAPQFSGFGWKLAEVAWRQRPARSEEEERSLSGRGRKRKVADGADNLDEMQEHPRDNEEEEGAFDWDAFTPEEREVIEKQVQDRSPDAGWVRLAAATALLRLCRGYDGMGGCMTGNDYLTLGLACQDCMPEVRRGLLDKIAAATEHFAKCRPNPQRAAKAAALYALYGADVVDNSNAQGAFERLRRWAKSRREAADVSAAAAAAAGGSGTLINEMPEFVLPFLVYFIAHHPDYDQESMFSDAEQQQAAGGHEGETSALSGALPLFLRSIQLALEVLIPPSPLGGNSKEAAAEVASQAAATLKILRQLKFCEILGLDGDAGTDEIATAASHQICDMALLLAKQLTQRALAGHQLRIGKFPGALTLPKMCFRPRKNLTAAAKRSDGSDLPAGFYPFLAEPLFSAALGLGSPAVAKPRGRGRSKPKARGEIVNKQHLPDHPPLKGKAGDDDGREVEETRSKRRAPVSSKQRPNAAVGEAGASRSRKPTARVEQQRRNGSPVRQQPRRGAKDVAGELLRRAGAASESSASDDIHDDGDDFEMSDEEIERGVMEDAATEVFSEGGNPRRSGGAGHQEQGGDESMKELDVEDAVPDHAAVNVHLNARVRHGTSMSVDLRAHTSSEEPEGDFNVNYAELTGGGIQAAEQDSPEEKENDDLQLNQPQVQPMKKLATRKNNGGATRAKRIKV